MVTNKAFSEGSQMSLPFVRKLRYGLLALSISFPALYALSACIAIWRDY